MAITDVLLAAHSHLESLFEAPAGQLDALVENHAPASSPSGTIGVTEANDTAAFTGTVTITGTMAVTEANDTSAFNGTETISGTIAVTETNDTSSFAGAIVVPVTGTTDVVEADDVAAFTGSVDNSSIVITGVLAAVAPDHLSFLGGQRYGKGPREIQPPGPVFRRVGLRRRYYDADANPVIGD